MQNIKKWVEDFGGSYRELERIVKHSNNLIDLIEAGDFLNGYCVEYINNSGNEIENKDIKTILTHEQYERNIYRVKESDQMKDIKIGEYVRTNDGHITKVKNSNYYMAGYIECEDGLVDRTSIKNHSKNIIDVIEAKDIIEFIEQKKFAGTDIGEKYIQQIHGIEELKYVKQEIKENGIKLISILTHEQYEQNEYKVKDNK